MGAAVIDVTPTVAAPMAGFVARTGMSTGMHDPLTVRAVCVDETAVVSVDVCGLDESFCQRVSNRCCLPEIAVLVHATHTHGSAQSMAGRLGRDASPDWIISVEDACVQAIELAYAARRPARILAGWGAEPGVARNRRRPDGPVDDSLAVIHLVADDDSRIAILISYACHPVVLGADNRQLTGDYPAVVRARLETEYPGATAIFLTGCAGDLNTGHSPYASITTAKSPDRTFAECQRIGDRIASAALAADLAEAGSGSRSHAAMVDLELAVPSRGALAQQAAQWREQATAEDAVQATVYRCWADWAERTLPLTRPTVHRLPWRARVAGLRWGDTAILALPGEPFCVTGQQVRQSLNNDRVTIVAGYTGGSPGYFPPTEEYPLGGYEVCEAHRYYGMPGPFARGSAERLADALTKVGRELRLDDRGLRLVQ